MENESCQQPLTLIDIELAHWEGTSKHHNGKIFDSLDNLNSAFIQDRNIEKIVFGCRVPEGCGIGYDVYFRKKEGRIFDPENSLRFAYGCPSCKNIIVGPPKLETFNVPNDLNYYCHRCNAYLGDYPTHERS